MHGARCGGFTLVEILVSLVIGALVLAGLYGVVHHALAARDAASARNDLTRQARFAMERMVTAVARSRRLMIPQADNPNTAWNEAVRDVLAVTLDPTIDRNGDGYADADNDHDGRVDEDPGADATNDGCPGICGIDDDGDGQVDEGNVNDDDEDGAVDEDPANGADDDGDGSVGEDPGADLNGDGAPGVKYVDDDGDGQVDEGNVADDDEDGRVDEDWLDPVVFHLQGSTLIERDPVPWDTNGDGVLDGRDWVEQPLAEGVSTFRIERVLSGENRSVLVDITLELTASNGDKVSFERRVRLGGRL